MSNVISIPVNWYRAPAGGVMPPRPAGGVMPPRPAVLPRIGTPNPQAATLPAGPFGGLVNPYLTTSKPRPAVLPRIGTPNPQAATLATSKPPEYVTSLDTTIREQAAAAVSAIESIGTEPVPGVAPFPWWALVLGIVVGMALK